MGKYIERPIGMCSWSMGNKFDEIAALNLKYIHLDISPALREDGQAYLEEIMNLPMTITSTMIGFAQEDYTNFDTIRATGGIVPDDCWETNKKLFLAAIDLTAKLPTKHLSCHFGFIDTENEESFKKLADRIKFLADAAQSKGITLLMETGQESAEHLKSFLERVNHPALKVNFDPANMILYAKGTPAEAIRTLAPWIEHVHIKDAIAGEPGQWGTEVAWGDGEVGHEAFMASLEEIGYTGPLMIEREAGKSRFEDVEKAVKLLRG